MPASPFRRSLAVPLGLVLGALTAGSPTPADACVHGPRGATIDVDQLGQQAIILHHDGREELVLSVEYSTDAPVEALALVVPVPSVPDDYGLADPELFNQVARWLAPERPLPRSAGGAKKKKSVKSAGSGIKLLRSHSVGPFEIQPIQGVGPEGAKALEAWMVDNEFESAPEEELKYYVERGWTFLAVKISPSGETLDTRDALPPLRISFASELIVYPLKLELTSTFPLRLTIITKQELPSWYGLGASALGLKKAYVSAEWSELTPDDVRIDSFVPGDAPSALRDLLDKTKFAADEYSIAVFRGDWDGATMGDQPEDLSFPAAPEGAQLTATTKAKRPPKKPLTRAQMAELEAMGVDASALGLVVEEGGGGSAEGSGADGPVQAPAADDTNTTPTQTDAGWCSVGGRGGGEWATLALFVFVVFGGGRRRRKRG